jgi:hypothetical protein
VAPTETSNLINDPGRIAIESKWNITESVQLEKGRQEEQRGAIEQDEGNMLHFPSFLVASLQAV